jgi:hypothetical protein
MVDLVMPMSPIFVFDLWRNGQRIAAIICPILDLFKGLTSINLYLDGSLYRFIVYPYYSLIVRKISFSQF